MVDQQQPLPCWAKNVGELWSTNKQDIGNMLTLSKCPFSVTWRNSIRHVVLGYGFRGHSLCGVAASGISTTSIMSFESDLGRQTACVGLCPIFLVRHCYPSYLLVGLLVRLLTSSLSFLGPNISETVRDRRPVPIDFQYEMAYGESNGHAIDKVTWPWKVKVVTPICLWPNNSKRLEV